MDAQSVLNSKAGSAFDDGGMWKMGKSSNSKRGRSEVWTWTPDIKMFTAIVFSFIALVFLVSGACHLVVSEDSGPPVTVSTISLSSRRVSGAGERLIKEPDGESRLLSAGEETVAAAQSLQELRMASDRCHHPLSEQHVAAYYEYAKTYKKVKTKVLNVNDGVGALESKIAHGQREITIVTQASVDRLRALETMAFLWGGSISAAVHVPAGAHPRAVYQTVKAVHDRVEARGYCKLNIQLVSETGFQTEADALSASYPVNPLRNVALRTAKTDMVFLLDVDFLPSPGLHEKLTTSESVYEDLKSRTQLLRQLLVVPAFARGLDYYNDLLVADDLPMPGTMAEVRARYLNGSIEKFAHRFPRAHEPTSYGHFLHPLTKDPYFVVHRDLYEPYVIADRAIIPNYDERFRGFGRNKSSHLYHCSVLGMSFAVLPETFVWAMDHPKSKSFQEFKKQNVEYDGCKAGVMKSLYEIFKEELHTMPYPA